LALIGLGELDELDELDELGEWVCATVCFPASRSLSPRMLTAFSNLYEFSSVQRIESVTIAADGARIERTIQIARSFGPDGRDRALIRFLSPSDLRGIGMLLTERAGRTEQERQSERAYDAFLYQPAFQRVRRVSLAQRSDPFFGTDLTVEDIESKRANEWRAGAAEPAHVAGRPSWKVDLDPIGAATAYERARAWFDQEHPIMLRCEFYVDDQLVKIVTANPQALIVRDRRVIPASMTFERPGRSKTTIRLEHVDVRSDLPARLFTRNTLEFGDAGSDARAQ
jgi:hypothetical protein